MIKQITCHIISIVVWFIFIQNSWAQKIIFESLRDANLKDRDNLQQYWELYSMDDDGSNVKRITNNRYYEHQPDISPDGKKIVYAIHYAPFKGMKEHDKAWEIAVMDIDGSNLKQLTNNDYLDSGAHWNHDGTKIVFMSDTSREGKCYDIYTMDADGKNLKKLTNATRAGEVYGDPSFSFSKGESKILYISYENSGFQLYIMNEDGSNQKKILSTNREMISFNDPMFSPDDKTIVFSIKFNKKGKHALPITDIFMTDAKGSFLKRITSNDGDSDMLPQFSPDGKKLVFLTWEKIKGHQRVARIKIISIDGSNEKILSSFFMEQMPSWYPD